MAGRISMCGFRLLPSNPLETASVRSSLNLHTRPIQGRRHCAGSATSGRDLPVPCGTNFEMPPVRSTLRARLPSPCRFPPEETRAAGVCSNRILRADTTQQVFGPVGESTRRYIRQQYCPISYAIFVPDSQGDQSQKAILWVIKRQIYGDFGHKISLPSGFPQQNIRMVRSPAHSSILSASSVSDCYVSGLRISLEYEMSGGRENSPEQS